MDDDFAAVVQQHVFVDHRIVFDGQVIAVRNFHAVENLHVLADVLEHVFRDHRAHAVPQPMVQPYG